MFRPLAAQGTRPAMVVRDRSFSRGNPVCDYWLTRCEGFVVRAGGRILGVVEAVEGTDPTGRAEELVVRRRRRAIAIPADDVLAVVPGRRELLTRRRHRAVRLPRVRLPDLRPLLRAAYATAKPLLEIVARTVSALAWTLVLRLASAARAVARHTRRNAGDAVRRWQGHAPGPQFDHRSAVENAYGFALRRSYRQAATMTPRGAGPSASP
jgi:hypothetical protein